MDNDHVCVGPAAVTSRLAPDPSDGERLRRSTGRLIRLMGSLIKKRRKRMRKKKHKKMLRRTRHQRNK